MKRVPFDVIVDEGTSEVGCFKITFFGGGLLSGCLRVKAVEIGATVLCKIVLFEKNNLGANAIICGYL